MSSAIVVKLFHLLLIELNAAQRGNKNNSFILMKRWRIDGIWNDESKSRFISELWKFIGQRWTQIYFDSVKMATKGVFVSFQTDCECISTNNMRLSLNMNLRESNSPFHFSSSSLAIFLNSRLWKQMCCYLFPSFGGVWFVSRSPYRNPYNKNMMN